ncbi:ATP-binding cassette domain-containing protein [Sphingobacterium wenxiniae]|uniref:Molybdate transport system ATP-binding protein n=1 Tax=Sphingobacterium wenxiniae TaxID=683125 RepID=A0A1I6UD26_9SPHI|nr:ATP-binding cassette domain-containing protein [Sphingobacterium wenxiniae]SFS99197.1 molybdate transport system ATP-binding protein [Sphingobacterium wenxiniae]
MVYKNPPLTPPKEGNSSSPLGRLGGDFVHISHLNLQYAGQVVLDDLNWSIHNGENWVIGGKSGTGKTSLAKAIAGQEKFAGEITFHFNEQLNLPARAYYVSNWYQFTNLEGDRNFYYQQRYNKFQKNDTLTVYADLMHFGAKNNLQYADVEHILHALGFENCKDTQLIELSSGEHKKLQLVQALWLCPQLLIIDEPFTGLDKQSRANLLDLFDEISHKGTTLILITNDQHLPSCINRFAEIENGKLKVVQSASDFSQDNAREKKSLPYFLQREPAVTSQTMVELKNVSVRYGDKVVLKNVSWTVHAGEKWLLQGPNGSGKSTLLSLLNGDHPQAYASDIWLFGTKRGSGESIWDIKEKIGIISPEMHWYFDKSATVWHTIASGFYDSIGWFIDVKYEEKKQIEQLLDFFDLLPNKDQLLHTLPLGKQRLALLARTIIKNPQLLILDEPCQGLDIAQTTHFNAVVDELCAHGKTLIYVGHYESQLPSCIDHKLILERGEVIRDPSIAISSKVICK